SRLGLARMKHLVPDGEEPDYNKVRKAYQEVIDRHPGHLAAEEAFIYLMATYISTLDPDDSRHALPLLKEFVADPAHKFIGPAHSLIAVAHQNLGEHTERLQAEIDSLNATEIDPTNPFTEFSWQYWNIATIAEFELGDFETARTYYRKLIEEYPTDIRVYGAKQAILRMEALEQKIRDELAGRRSAS
ncbi:MAG: tetratricopeptide repeat protein, partial [Kiritimatiellae bacterium]|nr:tetratricopeptide repeat protein [Kiritimatiellia bacterium]